VAAPRRLTRDRLLDVSAELFAEQGHEGTSISDITDALRITRPTLYAHAKSKAELVEAIHERLVGFHDRIALTQIPEDASPLERIEGAIRTHLEATRYFAHPLRIALNSARDASIPYSKKLHDRWHQQDVLLDRAIEDGQRLG